MSQNQGRLPLPSARAPFKKICAYHLQEMGIPFIDAGNLPADGGPRKETTVEELLLRQALGIIEEKRRAGDNINLKDAYAILSPKSPLTAQVIPLKHKAA